MIKLLDRLSGDQQPNGVFRAIRLPAIAPVFRVTLVPCDRVCVLLAACGLEHRVCGEAFQSAVARPVKSRTVIRLMQSLMHGC